MLLLDTAVDVAESLGQYSFLKSEAYLVYWSKVSIDLGVEVGTPEFTEALVGHLESGDRLREHCASIVTKKVIRYLAGDKATYYIVLSALQKAIRFGRSDLAVGYYRELVYNGYMAQARSRLKIIILEDVGVADPMLCLIALKWLSRKGFPDPFVEYLVGLAARTRKTRVQTVVLQRVYEEDFTENMNKAVKLAGLGLPNTPRELFFKILSMSGAKYKAIMPDVSRPPFSRAALVSELCSMIQCPVMKALVHELVATFLYVPFMASVPAALTVMGGDVLVGHTNPHSRPGMELIGNLGVLSEALDQYTSVGNRVYAYVRKSHAAYFDRIPNKKLSAFNEVVFDVESSYLHNRVSTTKIEAMVTEELTEVHKFEGWLSEEDAVEARSYLDSNPEPLLYARKRIWE